MTATIDKMCDALDRALGELNYLHYRYKLKDTSTALVVEQALDLYHKNIMRRRYRRASRRRTP